MRIYFLALGFAILASSSAHAYSIEDHRKITEIAIEEHRYCHPLQFPYFFEPVREEIQKGNRGEDTDLFRKWGKYSHYYHPEHTIDMRREDSSTRVRELVESIRGKTFLDGLEDLGNLIHHLQDITIPAHVIPVAHWITDGFESYELSEEEWPQEIWGVLSCLGLSTSREDRRARHPLDLLRETARETLATLSNAFTVSAFREAEEPPEELALDWTAFWQPSEDRGFGSYGLLGNHFGSTEIEYEDATVQVPESLYKGYKIARVRAAVDATREAIKWYSRIRRPTFLELAQEKEEELIQIDPILSDVPEGQAEPAAPELHSGCKDGH